MTVTPRYHVRAGLPAAATAHDHSHEGHDHDHDDHDHDDAEHPRVPRTHDAEALISARGLSLRYHGRPVLDRIDLEIHGREIVTLIGPNGAGKTSLVRLLLGLEKPSAGDIVRQPGLVVGYVPQRFDVDHAMPLTVSRFLGLGVRGTMTAPEQVLGEVGAGALVDRQFSKLSGGELQRVLMARALLREPQFLVLDEPVRGVDYSGEAELYALIERIREVRGVGILLVSHDLHVVMGQSDRVICINRHVCCSGVPRSVAEHPEYSRLFGPKAAREFALYQHAHDHHHDLSGAIDRVEPGDRVKS